MTSGVFHCLRVELFYCVTRDVVSPLSGRGDSVALATNKVKMDATLLTSCLLPFNVRRWVREKCRQQNCPYSLTRFIMKALLIV